VVDLLGQGTFGQVVKCINTETHEQVAVKIVKNKRAYYNQGQVEARVLELVCETAHTHTHTLSLSLSVSHVCVHRTLLIATILHL
jgi:serine/threonine protein kinase